MFIIFFCIVKFAIVLFLRLFFCVGEDLLLCFLLNKFSEEKLFGWIFVICLGDVAGFDMNGEGFVDVDKKQAECVEKGVHSDSDWEASPAEFVDIHKEVWKSRTVQKFAENCGVGEDKQGISDWID